MSQTTPKKCIDSNNKNQSPGLCDEANRSIRRNCDEDIINYVQDAIISIKALKQHCNISRIFSYLKEKMPDNEKIADLTETCLIRQLELAVEDGILSKKFKRSMSGSENKTNGLSSNYRLNIEDNASQVFKLPVSDFTLQESVQGKQLGALLQLLMKSMAYLNKQHVSANIEATLGSESNESSSTLDQICQFMKQTYNFELDKVQTLVSPTKQTMNIAHALNECVGYLLKKNEGKIFHRVKNICEDGSETAPGFKLNKLYIHKKLIESQKLHKNHNKDKKVESENDKESIDKPILKQEANSPKKEKPSLKSEADQCKEEEVPEKKKNC